MAEHDYVIANQNGANTRSDLNNALAAIVSNNSKATAPTTTYAFMWWADTANDILKQRNAADSAWISILTLSTGAPLGALAASLVSGTHTNFTSTGIDDNATSTAITIDASENVGIGTSSPDRALTVYTTAATDNNLLLKSGAANAYLTFADNGTTDQTGLSVRIGSSGNAMVFNTGGTTERMRIQSGGGISFNGDTAAANALDDYEEGTWTPTTNSGWGALTFDGVGSYTKIGNIVHISVHILIDGSGTGSGDTTIGGLPFTPNTTDDFRPAISVYAEKLNTSISTYISGLVDTAALIYIREGGRTDSGSDLGVHFDGGSGIFLQATYTAT